MLRILGVLLFAGVLVLGWLFGTHEAAPVAPAWAVSGDAEIPEGAVSVRYTGCATLLFSDGETAWMTDGWFSRPGPLALALTSIGPDSAAITKGLERNGVEELAMVFPLHSHYDHAMDAPEVAQRTGAMLVGSESTANIGRGWGLDESRIRVVADREPLQLGRFVVTPIVSRHFEFPDPAVAERALGDPEIRTPLVPPVSAFDYKVGEAYVLHVRHPRGSFLVIGSAGYVEGALDGLEADVVFLGIGGLGSQTAEYREAYWRETIGRVAPSRVIPIHWDGLTNPIEGPFRGSVRIVTFLMGNEGPTRAFLEDKERGSSEFAFQTLPRYDPVVLF